MPNPIGVSTPLTPEQRSQRARLAAHTLHAKGGTNTGPARTALDQRFLDEVDPDRELPEAERQKRAEHARKAHMAKLSLLASKAQRQKKKGGWVMSPEECGLSRTARVAGGHLWR